MFKNHLNPGQITILCNRTMMIANKILTQVWDRDEPNAAKTGAQIGTLVEGGLTISEITLHRISQETDKVARMNRWRVAARPIQSSNDNTKNEAIADVFIQCHKCDNTFMKETVLFKHFEKIHSKVAPGLHVEDLFIRDASKILGSYKYTSKRALENHITKNFLPHNFELFKGNLNFFENNVGSINIESQSQKTFDQQKIDEDLLASPEKPFRYDNIKY